MSLLNYWLVVLRIYVSLAIFQPYLQAKSLTITPPLLHYWLLKHFISCIKLTSCTLHFYNFGFYLSVDSLFILSLGPERNQTHDPGENCLVLLPESCHSQDVPRRAKIRVHYCRTHRDPLCKSTCTNLLLHPVSLTKYFSKASLVSWDACPGS